MSNKKYWQSFGELNQSEAYQQSSKNEFREELPFEADDKGFMEAIAPRRDFLKYLGFSTAAAAIAASCEIPVKKAIPFANKPEDIVPGVAYWYATTFVQDGEAISVLAKVRDGRPIKIEGNELSPITQGGTSAKVQASVLDLYDAARLRFPTIDGKEVTLEAIDKGVSNALAGLGGAPVVLLTTTVNSPTTLQVINQFLAKYPGSRHVMYDPISYSGLLQANEATHGRRAIPSYQFDKAKVIVSIGADFLATWLSPVEFAKQYSKGRKIDEKNPSMSKHIHFETVSTVTGANADERYLHRPSETGAIVAALLNAINGQGATGISDAALKAGIEKTAKTLSANKGAALVVCGSNDTNVQIAVNAINEALQANGNTIDWSVLNNSKSGVDADFAKLVDDMNAGSIGAILIHEANPAYTWYDAEKFKNALKKVKVSVSFSPIRDETTLLCKYVVPNSHYLESWGDAEPKSGYFSLMQPTIHPLFKTRQWQDSLLKWSGATTTYLDLVKTYWISKLGNEAAWDKTLQEGVINPGGTAANTIVAQTTTSSTDTTNKQVATPVAGRAATFNNAPVANAVGALGSAKKGGNIELVLYQKVGVGNGHGASNPWLQELPDPVTRATWDNYVIISPSMAKSLLGIDLLISTEADEYEVRPAKRVLTVSANGKTVSLPFLIAPGTHPNVIGIALGYGRNKELGRTSDGVGKNIYPFASFVNNNVSYSVADVSVQKTDDKFDVAQVQTHGSYDTPQGVRTEVLKELSLASLIKDPNQIREEREEEAKPWGGLENFTKNGTIYPYYDKPGIHWGMNIDLNSCVGCGACVVACIAENNVPIVGKHEVKRFHDMHWLRIDRYYSGSLENPKITFQPMLCQHCDNAPCENVCPVSATNHSNEGLNQMVYNRCVGTRYCANNCPYKVRRFNWADYTGADSFPNNQDQTIVGVLDPAVHVMNEDVSRMVLNPDVTVRSRGVMEKCTFCVQRLQEGKLRAKKESRPLKSGENNEWDIKTACQQACPTDAIVFGNINDSKSVVAQTRVENQKRQFYVIEQLHTLPNVSYLAKVRNTDEIATMEEEGKLS